ncbi:hypothetical protein D6D17_10433 [Aureobasidium pullulans]|nr:hypothetical protein D6D17_10433 [Aureobasidium pullulans]
MSGRPDSKSRPSTPDSGRSATPTRHPFSPDEQDVEERLGTLALPSPAVPLSEPSPHARFVPTRDRDDADVREPDPTPAPDHRFTLDQRPVLRRRARHDPLRLFSRRGTRAQPLPAYNSGPGTPVAGPSSSSPSSTSSSSSTSQASSADFANELIQVRTEPIRVRTQLNGAAGPQVPTEPDVAAAQRLGLPPVRRISWPHDEPRSGFHRCRSWCATSCKQMFNAAKFWESKKKD